MTPLDTAFANWTDSLHYHAYIYDHFGTQVPSHNQLYNHRQWIKDNEWGFGEDGFHFVWLLLAQSLPSGFRFCELGVHKGQSLSAVALAAELVGKEARVIGIGPLNGVGGWYEERDYSDDVATLFRKFNSDRQPTLIRKLSTDPEAVAQAQTLAPFDALYIDSDHTQATASFEFTHYSPLIRSGGYLLCDDSGCNLDLPFDQFPGFKGSSDFFDSVLPPKTANPDWTHVGNCSHLRIWRRI